VVHGLLAKVRGLAGIGGEERPGIVHRLDKETSGCLVVAKSEVALRGLQSAFKERTVTKQYRALVHGDPPPEGTFDTFFGRHPVDRKRFSSKVEKGRRAVTSFRVLERGPSVSLLDVDLHTGRTHQIRAHFADAGWPLLGDRLYGGVRRESRLAKDAPARAAARTLGRQALHAAVLAFDHPITGMKVVCEAPLPDDLRAALRILGMRGDRQART
jgi:23S rRNA pseudouridine1911/1915/1917 synthase